MEDSENTHVEQTPVDTREQKWPILMYTTKLAILTMEKDDIVLAKEIIKRRFFLFFSSFSVLSSSLSSVVKLTLK